MGEIMKALLLIFALTSISPLLASDDVGAVLMKDHKFEDLVLAENEWIIYDTYSSDCMNRFNVRAACLSAGLELKACKKTPDVLESTFSGAQKIPTNKTIVTCEGAPNVSNLCLSHLDDLARYDKQMTYQIDYVPTFCSNLDNPNETAEEFKQRLSCYPESIKSKMLTVCPVGCGNAPTGAIHTCNWTREEHELRKHCGLDSGSSLYAMLFRERICPDGKPDLVPGKGNAPEIKLSRKSKYWDFNLQQYVDLSSTDYSAMKDAAGNTLDNYYYSEALLTISQSRENKGTYCVYKQGQSCSQEIPYANHKNNSSFSTKIGPFEDGNYIVEATSVNGVKSTKAFTVISNLNTKKVENVCRMKTGLLCSADGKEIESFYFCGEKPVGSGWQHQADQSYHRYTGNTCEQDERFKSRLTEVKVEVKDIEEWKQEQTQVANDPDRCELIKGTFCAGNGKETEFLSLCNVQPPGEGWVAQTNGMYHRYTGASCDKANRNEVMKREVVSISKWLEENNGSAPPATASTQSTPANQCVQKGGLFCPANGKETEWIVPCDGQQPQGAGWVSQPNGSFHRYTGKSCAGASDTGSSGQCLYYDYTSTSGNKNDKYLKEGDVVSRNIIVEGQLKLQRITCKGGGKLAAVE